MDRVRFFSIRYKILALLSFLLLICVVSYLMMAIQTFKRDKTELVFDFNRSVVVGLGKEFESTLAIIKAKLDLAKDSQIPLEKFLAQDPLIVYLQAGARTYLNPTFAKIFEVPISTFVDQVEGSAKITGAALWRIEGYPDLVGFRHFDGGIEQRVVFRISSVLESIARYEKSQVFLINKKGESLVDVVAEGHEPLNSQTKEIALASLVKTQVFKEEKPDNKKLTAFYKGSDDFIFITCVREDLAFQALQDFTRRSLVFAGFVATLALMAGILFSRQITDPIQKLVQGMTLVGQGSLEKKIWVNTHDETSLLASSFNKMIEDLRLSRSKLEEINLDLENKVKERTVQLETQNQAVKEAQEALLRTTRLASVGEVAARAAHEVLNPLTGMLTRLQLVQKRQSQTSDSDLNLFQEILSGWIQDFEKGGLNEMLKQWQKPSLVDSKILLIEEDLQNLAAIVKNLQAHQKTQAGKNSEDAKFLIQEAHRISKIVQNMRALSQVQSSKQRLSAKQLLEETKNIMADLFEQKQIQFDLKLRHEQDLIFVDRDEFIQSLTNLLRNSVQAVLDPTARPGPKWVKVMTGEIKSASGIMLSIEVEDSGCGISEDDHLKLFQTQFTTKNAEDGTGLGLSISRRFIRSFGGDVQLLQSRPGFGSSFRVTIPTREAE